MSIKIPHELLDRWLREDEEARRIRRDRADWNFINRQRPQLRIALTYYVENGDIVGAAKLAKLTIDEFNELRIQAKIPWI